MITVRRAILVVVVEFIFSTDIFVSQQLIQFFSFSLYLFIFTIARRICDRKIIK